MIKLDETKIHYCTSAQILLGSFAVIASVAMYFRYTLGCLTLAGLPLALGAPNATAQSLNTTNTNLIPNAQGGPVLYYNGTGPVPGYDEVSPDPAPITPINSTSMLESAFYAELFAIANGSSYSADNCTQCIAGAQVVHLAAITLPVQNFVSLLVDICNASPAVQSVIFSATCEAEYGSTQNTSIPYSSGGAGAGAYYAQLFAKMSLATEDMATYCYWNFDVCAQPQPVGIEESLYFDTKPSNASTAPPPSGMILATQHEQIH